MERAASGLLEPWTGTFRLMRAAELLDMPLERQTATDGDRRRQTAIDAMRARFGQAALGCKITLGREASISDAHGGAAA